MTEMVERIEEEDPEIYKPVKKVVHTTLHNNATNIKYVNPKPINNKARFAS
jgi:hypothetical protein